MAHVESSLGSSPAANDDAEVPGALRVADSGAQRSVVAAHGVLQDGAAEAPTNISDEMGLFDQWHDEMDLFVECQRRLGLMQMQIDAELYPLVQRQIDAGQTPQIDAEAPVSQSCVQWCLGLSAGSTVAEAHEDRGWASTFQLGETHLTTIAASAAAVQMAGDFDGAFRDFLAGCDDVSCRARPWIDEQQLTQPLCGCYLDSKEEHFCNSILCHHCGDLLGADAYRDHRLYDHDETGVESVYCFVLCARCHRDRHVVSLGVRSCVPVDTDTDPTVSLAPIVAEDAVAQIDAEAPVRSFHGAAYGWVYGCTGWHRGPSAASTATVPLWQDRATAQVGTAAPQITAWIDDLARGLTCERHSRS